MAQYGDLLHEDLKMRDYLFKRLSQAGVSRVVIERPAKKARVTIHSARPGVVIGKKGADIEKLRQDVSRMTGIRTSTSTSSSSASPRSTPSWWPRTSPSSSSAGWRSAAR